MQFKMYQMRKMDFLKFEFNSFQKNRVAAMEMGIIEMGITQKALENPAQGRTLRVQFLTITTLKEISVRLTCHIYARKIFTLTRFKEG